MKNLVKTQREWLLEDIEQIQRYFPGAELIESFETPFDIDIRSETVVKPVRSTGASEQRAGECGLAASEAMLAPEERQASLDRTVTLFLCPGDLL